MTIGVGTCHVQEFISGQSVMFVAIAFITMMIISLAWLIFYYIQRFLYTGSQFGSQGELEDVQEICPLQNRPLEVFWLQIRVLLYKTMTEVMGVIHHHPPLVNPCHRVMYI